jgi:hypothetical protein
VTELRGKEAHLSARLAAWRRQAGREMTEARQRLEAVEASLDHLEQQAEEKDDEEDTDRQGFGFEFRSVGQWIRIREGKNDPQK